MRASILLALAAAALFGAATPLCKALLGTVDAFTLAGLLYLGAGLALAPRALKGGLPARLRSLDARNRWLVLGSVACGGFLGPVLLLSGLAVAKSASVSLWLNLELVATAILGQFLFRDRMTRASAGATLGILGASVLLTIEGGRAGALGGLLVGAACLAWGFDNHFTALIDGLGPVESTFLKGAAAGSVNLVLGLAFSGTAPGLPAAAGALAIGALSYGLSIVLYISSAQGLGASRAQLFFSSSPVFGMLLAYLGLRESVSVAQGAAMLLMALSYAILAGERHGHGHGHDAIRHTHWHRHGEGHHEHDHVGLTVAARFYGHSHAHDHEAVEHDHAHVPDIHHRHGHDSPR